MPSSSRRQQHYTEQEFAALVKASDKRLELWEGEVFDRSYTSPGQRDIVRNLADALRRRLKAPCAAYTGEPIRPPRTTGLFREPDLVVLCGERKLQTIQGLELTTNPALIVEVVSPETERLDRNEKLDEYRRIATLREYLIVAQRSPTINQWSRRNDLWVETVGVGLAASLALNLPAKITLPLKEVYRGIQFR
jgi:Uma2 family endonuclease